MQKMIRKYMFIALVLFFFQLLAGIFFFLVYKLVPDFDYLPETLIISICVFIIINIFYVWLILSNISKARKKNDITAVEIVGEDIQEVYNFGELGIILVDDNNQIIWTNDWFEDIQSTIVDLNIFSWKSELGVLQDPKNDTTQLELDNRVYDVKYLREANLFIFKDITDYNATVQFSKEHAPVIGLIAIDNYQDVMSLIDDTRTNDLIASIQRIIFDYAKEHGILLRQYHADSYSFIATHAQYEEMLDKKFDLLDRIRAINESENNDLTISMGIALGSDDYVRLNELAASALDVCLSRGGDQVVIQPYGENLIFLGGKFEAKTKRSRVKVRILSKSLETLINDASNVYVMGHVIMDLDALGSAIGICDFVRHCNKKVQIIYDEKLVESKTKKALKQVYTRDEIKDMIISPKQASEEIGANTLIILSDVHKPSFTLYPKILEVANKVAVIDHHRRGEEFVESPVFSYVEPSASSASELVVELIRYNEKHTDVTEKDATMMLGGILLDTNYYRNKTGSRTYDASLYLKECGADNLVADSFLKEEFEEHALKVKIMATAVTPFMGIVVCKASEEDIIDRTMLSIVAQDTLQIKGVNACFVVGRNDSKQVSISARSDGTVNVQYLMEKMSGGGHFTAAAVQFDNKTIEDVSKGLLDILNLYLAEARTERK